MVDPVAVSKRSTVGKIMFDAAMLVIQLGVIAWGCWTAYEIRTYAIKTFGRIIHEFDPWFNYRATEYLHEHGRVKFFTWFDHMSWSPLGRPVGTTIYPGMQFTAVGIFHVLKFVGLPMSLNDVCCLIPCWFGVIASLLTGGIAYESTGSLSAFAAATVAMPIMPTQLIILTIIITGGIAYESTGSLSAFAAATVAMSMMPAHLMRSIGGGYDNESIAVTAMCLTFYLWMRSLHSEKSWPYSIAAAFAYFYMAAAWGGYVFVINLVGAHAGVLMVMGRFNFKLYRAYSIFYGLGTLLAIQIPVVCPLGLFVVFQLLWLCELTVIKKTWSPLKKLVVRVLSLLLASALFAGVIYLLMPTGVLGPVSLRVRSLFIQHTRTGNPLVDSVAEHKATSPDAYWQFLHYACFVAPVGAVFTILFGRRGDGKYFILIYAVIALYFANKMNRLVILLGPVAAGLSGVALGLIFDWCMASFANGLSALLPSRPQPPPVDSPMAPQPEGGAGPLASPAPPTPSKKDPKKAEKERKAELLRLENESRTTPARRIYAMGQKGAASAQKLYNTRFVKLSCTAIAVMLLSRAPAPAQEFYQWSDNIAQQLGSNPHVLVKARLNDGTEVMARFNDIAEVMVADYMDGYNFLKKKTPKDARILAWWDYGYQITGIGNRTSLADGNTWNQAHIALIGKMLTSTEPKAHKLIRHMADYVLVWAGGGGDDLAKSPHLARIASSNFPKHCGSDRTCNNFGFYKGYQDPTPMMGKSLLYRLVANQVFPGVTINQSLWEEVFRSKYGKIRIYKVKDVDMKSRKWSADPANKLCDRPGSWYCPGQYPPAIWPHLPAHFLKGHRLSPNSTAEENAAAMAGSKGKPKE
eukprot:gene22889-30064_t